MALLNLVLNIAENIVLMVKSERNITSERIYLLKKKKIASHGESTIEMIQIIGQKKITSFNKIKLIA